MGIIPATPLTTGLNKFFHKLSGFATYRVGRNKQNREAEELNFYKFFKITNEEI